MRRLGAILAVLAGCGGPAVTVSFHASDPAFRPVAGAKPRVYSSAEVVALPAVPMRSVGVIAVQVRKGNERTAALRAGEKGRELGCWIVVEHAAFSRARAERTLLFGARVWLAHGGAPHATGAKVPHRVVEFDCVVQGAAPA